MTLTKIDAAQVLGAAVHEIVDVIGSPAGDVISCADGTTFVFVPADNPDGAGKTGLMFLHVPERYKGDFPAYVLPAEADESGQLEPAGVAFAREVDEQDLAVLKVDELKALAADHGVDVGDAKKKDELVAVLLAAGLLVDTDGSIVGPADVVPAGAEAGATL